MIPKLFLIVLMTLLQIQMIKGSDLEFYVAVDGSDTWDGTSPEVSAGTTTGKVILNFKIGHLKLASPLGPHSLELSNFFQSC